MASAWTNRGKYLALGGFFRAETVPTNFYIHMLNSTPTVDTNIMSDETEASNYTPISIARNSTDFDVWTEDDATNDDAFLQIKDTVITASGGTMTATYAVLTDDNGTVGSRQIFAYFDLGATQNITDTNTLTLVDLELKLS